MGLLGGVGVEEVRNPGSLEACGRLLGAPSTAAPLNLPIYQYSLCGEVGINGVAHPMSDAAVDHWV